MCYYLLQFLPTFTLGIESLCPTDYEFTHPGTILFCSFHDTTLVTEEILSHQYINFQYKHLTYYERLIFVIGLLLPENTIFVLSRDQVTMGSFRVRFLWKVWIVGIRHMSTHWGRGKIAALCMNISMMLSTKSMNFSICSLENMGSVWINERIQVQIRTTLFLSVISQSRLLLYVFSPKNNTKSKICINKII